MTINDMTEVKEGDHYRGSVLITRTKTKFCSNFQQFFKNFSLNTTTKTYKKKKRKHTHTLI